MDCYTKGLNGKARRTLNSQMTGPDLLSRDGHPLTFTSLNTTIKAVLTLIGRGSTLVVRI